jgi:hypothetical protein
MENARERYEKMKTRYAANRKTFDITVSSGMVFKCVSPKTFDMVRIYELLGVDPDKLSGMSEKELGMRLITHARVILDELVVKCVVEPRLLPSTVANSNDADAILVNDLCSDDKEDLLNQIMRSVKGEEGGAKAESFPGDASGKVDGRSG